MADREEVIKGLECLARKQEPSANPCKGCGYNDRANFAFCVVDVASDALELLREQEPRVLSYEQIEGIVEDVVWVEIHGREAVEPWIVHQGKVWRPDYNTGYEHWEVSRKVEYNFIIRCWTSKPSYEQRKAVKWG